MNDMEFSRIKCVALVMRGKSVLVYKRKAGFWYFPGGGVEKGENLEQCAEREVMEETGLKVKVKSFLYARIFSWKPYSYKALELFFLAKPISGKLKPEKKTGQKEMVELKFVPIKSLGKLELLTPEILKQIQKDFKRGFADCPQILGMAEVLKKY